MKKKMIKIKAKNNKISSMKLIVPVDGEITIDVNGVAVVSPKCAVALVNGTADWDYASKKKVAVEEDEDEEDEEEDDDEDVSQRDKFSAHLDSLKFEEMKALAKEGGFSADEYEKINSKKLLKAYLLGKYDEAEKNGEMDETSEDGEEKE